jgi:RNA polymerase sigma-70 factor (ECF subfamily)
LPDEGGGLLSESQILESALYVVRFQRGDADAFEQLVKLWERPLFYYVRRISGSEADAWELLQETWLKLFRSLGSLRDPRTLPAFVYATARNTAISRLRKRGSQEMESYTDELHAGTAEAAVDAFDNAELVHHALDQLPLAQREALTLFFLQDLSLEEIATLLDVPLGTVKSRLHYAKIAIRKLLSGDEHVR